MFVRLRIMAHDALKNYMHGDHEPMYDDTIRRIYAVIAMAETNEAFANSLDMECAEAFDGQTAEDYDDLVNLFDCLDDAPDGLQDLLTRYGITTEE